MVEWTNFIDVLGKRENSIEFTGLCRSIDEVPDISSDPNEYNDPVGNTKYYKFYQSGIEIGFRGNLLNHVHFYFFKEEGYSPFLGYLGPEVKGGISKEKVVQLLGKPSSYGEGKTDMLIGYINAWSKYENEKYSLHLQFNKDDALCRATLMK